MRVEVLFFGQLRDVTGRSSETVELEPGATMETLFARYASQFPRLRAMAASIAMARNREFVAAAEPLADGDEAAFMPPVSGGSAPVEASAWIVSAETATQFYAVTARPIDSRALAARLQTGDDGAVLTFEGVTRNRSQGRRTLYLDYECYAPMALAKMREIGAELPDRHGVRAVGIVHRVGRLQIGEASVAIVVCSAHRAAAYEASREAIDRLKRLVPIWKKETFEDGEVWVEGAWEESVPRATDPGSGSP